MAAQARCGMPLSGGIAATTARRRQRDFGFPHQIRRKIRHVCRGRLRRLRALLLRRSARRRDFPLALRAEGGALEAYGLRPVIPGPSEARSLESISPGTGEMDSGLAAP